MPTLARRSALGARRSALGTRHAARGTRHAARGTRHSAQRSALSQHTYPAPGVGAARQPRRRPQRPLFDSPKPATTSSPALTARPPPPTAPSYITSLLSVTL
ncbi:hypothetical protein C0R03_05155 [Streptomyces albidoflavus]|nr:hypothetical protein C0R03_05155 [Streptomyces albidoflavus]